MKQKTQTSETKESTSTPAKADPVKTDGADNQKSVDAANEQVACRSLLPQFPIVVRESQNTVVVYGSHPLTFPIGNKGEIGVIDSAMLSGKNTRRLLHITKALKVAGREDTTENKKWFNTEVRDVWHKVLRFAARDSLANGKPVSIGLSFKTQKKTGRVILTSRHGFEHVVKEGNAKAIEDKANKQSKNRAKRQQRKSRRISPLPNPVITETVTVATETVVNAGATPAAA